MKTKSIIKLQFIFLAVCVFATTLAMANIFSKQPIQEQYTIETALIEPAVEENGYCNKLRINISRTDEGGTKWLVHTATILTGANCASDGKVLSSTTYNVKDYIVEDPEISGVPITDFFDANPDMFPAYIQSRDNRKASSIFKK
ncbi:hypothetical protein E0W68_08510 [Flavobacterium salilacus subsp. salilacus]|uniref:hypothetical protein n=1 Tax=Flavobacterium TaxID=237 RepID=UPI001074E898|nr:MULTISPECIES: hypothetical protein [Flavobacterium]KAF2518780.1 hypothetical protein E0W68_08510 [Flavobacterium salilacus subsp. salilacus]MBE1613748.1 hypothetical protein [Flavobacterium sp. SaA2.13]